MGRKPRANVTPEDVGKFYTDGESVFELMKCESEPVATLEDLSKRLEPITHPISAFKDFVRLIPERPVESKKPVRGKDKVPGGRKRKGGESLTKTLGTLGSGTKTASIESHGPDDQTLTPAKAEEIRQKLHITCPNCPDKKTCIKVYSNASMCWEDRNMPKQKEGF